jgi:glucose-6-phosphate isomerase
MATCGLRIDLSRHLVTQAIRNALDDYAKAVQLPTRIEALFSAQTVNNTEQRAAMHMALRSSREPYPSVDQDLSGLVNEVNQRLRAFVERVRDGSIVGHTGKTFRSVVNIGIGGSDLGPRLVCDALEESATLSAHFVSNLDRLNLDRVLGKVDAESTLFIIASKSFGTQETLSNARSAREWLVRELGDESAVAAHFIALSTNEQRVVEFGIARERMFGFWDWVGGRFSLWSVIGCSIALAHGWEVFAAVLRGAEEMDDHFRCAPIRENVPVQLALLQFWYSAFLGAQSHCVLTYDWALRLLPDHLQQLLMESLGKGVDRQGEAISLQSGPIVWGGAGNNGQHAYYQLLHQGTVPVPSDFIVAARSQSDDEAHDLAVIANAIAQADTLAHGRTLTAAADSLRSQGKTDEEVERLAPHLVMPGGQPSTVILYETLSPQLLGAIIAMYEHIVYAHSVLIDINAFDQWGVELGKIVASEYEKDLRAGSVSPQRSESTRELLETVLAMRAVS